MIMSILYSDILFVIRRQKYGTTEDVSSSKTVTIPMTNSKHPIYYLTC